MKPIAALRLLSLALLCVPTAQAEIIESFGTGTNSFTMTFVPIGNPGNAADTTGTPNPAGSVGDHYNLGKHEVSRDMINKANAEGNLGITLFDMTALGGNGANRPATGISWNEAARYVNWLNTSKGFSPAYKFATQPGDVGYNANANMQLWQPGDPGYNAANLFRNSQAKYVLPSMDEWYKAAFYDPNANGGAGSYWDYPTGSNTVPTDVAGGTAAGTAVYGRLFLQGPADIDNAGGLSPYGVMGMGGNVSEWEETEFVLVNNDPSSGRGVRGGEWNSTSNILSASYRNVSIFPEIKNPAVGFRVASIPEIPEPTSPQLILARPYHDMFPGPDGPEKVDTSVSLIRRDSTAQLATLSNITSSSQGINGLVLDFDQLDSLEDISLEYRMSPQNVFDLSIASWPDAPAPSSATLLADAGEAGGDRVLIKWSSGSITNRYLCIKVIVGGSTIAELYLGHLKGEMTGGNGTVFSVSYAADLQPIRIAVGTAPGAGGRPDVDKNNQVQLADIVAMRTNAASQLTQLSVPALP